MNSAKKSKITVCDPSTQSGMVPLLSEAPDLSNIFNATCLEEFQSSKTEIEFLDLPFDHPLYIMYSSGTTGVPKCIVHGAGGSLIKHLTDSLSNSPKVF